MFTEYADMLKSLPGVTATRAENGDREKYIFTSSAPNALETTLYLWKGDGCFVDLEVQGVDTSYWHTAEEESLDGHIAFAKAALRGDVAYGRSPILKFNEVCFKLDGKWECTRADGNHSFHYITRRKRPRGKAS